MSDIFISHVNEDREFAQLLANVFEKQGWSVWNEKRVSAGQDWSELIEKEIESARVIVVLWSRYSTMSDRSLDEAEHGKRKGNLFPILIDNDAEIPPGFETIQVANLAEWKGDPDSPALRRTLSVIENYLNETETSTLYSDNSAKVKGYDEVARSSKTAGKTKQIKYTLSKQLKSLEVEPSHGCVMILNLTGALAEARLSATKGIMTSHTLLFGLAGASADYGRDIDKLLIDDISLDFSRIISESAAFEKLFRSSYGSISSGWVSMDGFEFLDKLNVSEGFIRLLYVAAKVSKTLDKTGHLFPEHLLAALLTVRETQAAQILMELGKPQDKMREALILTLDRTKKGMALDSWRRLLGAGEITEDVTDNTAEQAVEKTPEVASDELPESTKVNETSSTEFTKELIAAHYASDNPDADDLIGVEDEARSFARYITKSNLSTPIAIGLFGDWGSGKTFFMRKMQKFTNDLQLQGHIDRKLKRKSSWCDNVVQIEFNAWHYIESNLWASLVEHIFSEMDAWLTKNNKTSTIDELYKVFESAQEVKREAEAELNEAEIAHDDAKNALKDAKDSYEKAVKEHRTLSARDIWSAITQSFAKQQDDNPVLKKSVKDASKTLGIDELRSSAKKLHEVVNQAGDVTGRSQLLISSLFSRKRSSLRYVFLVALLALAPLAMSFIWSWAGSLQQVGGMMQSIGAGVAELSGLMTVIAGWGAFGIRSANNAIATLEEADAKLKNIIETTSNQQREELALAESDVATTEKRVSLAEQRVSSAVDTVDKARQRLEAETPRARLTRFLRRRLENADYAKHLGVISMIRKDFELLSRIMTGEEWTDADRKKLEKAGVDLVKARAFERIILYIDDLDRCPAERVVEVLQAVHLLLAFPLFVVVVGVDARWVSRALSMSYQHLLSETVARDIERAPNQGADNEHESNNVIVNDNHDQESLRVSELIASSHDYLEKIFQIPYWVKPMDKDSSKEFIEKLALLSLNEIEHKEPRHQERDHHKLINSGLEQHDEARETVLDNVAADQVDVINEEVQNKDLDESTNVYQVTQNEIDDTSKDLSSTTELTLVELPLSKYEIEFMKVLAPNIGRSPRRSKRFFNVYQLVRAGLSAEERSKFIGDKGESLDYRVLMCLLAIVTGAPILSPKYFSEVVNWDEQGKVSLSALIKRISKDDAFYSSTEWPRCSGTLDVLHSLGQDTKTFERVRHWTRRAMRFSFTARPV